MIPDEATEAANKAVYRSFKGLIRPLLVETVLEAAAPHMVIQVHHHDIENHARSFNEGYETAMAQELADNPSLAGDWLDEKIREAKADAWAEGRQAGHDHMIGKQTSNPYRNN